MIVDGQDHQRRFQPLGSVDRHDPHCIGRSGGIPLHLHLALTEPGKETVKRCDFLLLEGDRTCHQLLDRIARRFTQPPQELAPTIMGARQDPLQESRRRHEVCLSQPSGKDRMRLRPVGLFIAAVGQLGPKLALAPKGQPIKLVLVPSDQR
jgi:hypothetical protein